MDLTSKNKIFFLGMNCTKIGQGNHGTVYSLDDEENKAIKITNPKDIKYLKNIQNEFNCAFTAGNISSQHSEKTVISQVSPKVYSFGFIFQEDNTKFVGYIIMDKIFGKSISSINEYNLFKENLIDKFVLLRKNGIIVNDIGTENIMIGKILHLGDNIENVVEDIYIIDYGDNETAPVLTNTEEPMFRKDFSHFLETEFKIELSGYIKEPIPIISNQKLTIQQQREKAKKWAFTQEIKKIKKTLTQTPHIPQNVATKSYKTRSKKIKRFSETKNVYSLPSSNKKTSIKKKYASI